MKVIDTCDVQDVIVRTETVLYTYPCGAPATVEIGGSEMCPHHARLAKLEKEIRSLIALSGTKVMIVGRLAAHDAYREPTA